MKVGINSEISFRKFCLTFNLLTFKHHHEGQLGGLYKSSSNQLVCLASFFLTSQRKWLTIDKYSIYAQKADLMRQSGWQKGRIETRWWDPPETEAFTFQLFWVILILWPSFSSILRLMWTMNMARQRLTLQKAVINIRWSDFFWTILTLKLLQEIILGGPLST